MWSGFLAHTSIKQKPVVILWLLGFLGGMHVWLPSCGKVVWWEQQNEKTRFILHKGYNHQDSAGQAESDSLGLINHDLHSFIQHIQAQTHITLPASSADSSFLLLFNMWPYARNLVPPAQVEKNWDGWQHSSLVLRFSLSVYLEKIVTFIYMFKVCIANALLVYIFPFLSGECTALFRFNGIHSGEWQGLNRLEKMGR